VPLVLPPVVGGVALLSAFGRRGVVGGPVFDAFGVSLPFTTAAVVVAHTFVALPFFVLAVEGALRAADREYDVVAATLGAGRWTTFRRVSLPLAAPGLLAGLVLGWARALGEFGATITFAGNYPGTTRTMPNAIYTALQTDQDTALVLSVILMVVCVAVLALLRDRWFDQAVQGSVRR
jgi:molybdate transport system permease protein